MKMFMLSFENGRFAGKAHLFDAFLSNHRNIERWSSPFPGCYFIASNSGAKELAQSLDEFFEKKGFIVAEIGSTSDLTNGRAIAEIWQFIKMKAE